MDVFQEQNSAATRELKRLFNPTNSNHFASADPGEWADAQNAGYQLENTLCWVP